MRPTLYNHENTFPARRLVNPEPRKTNDLKQHERQAVMKYLRAVFLVLVTLAFLGVAMELQCAVDG